MLYWQINRVKRSKIIDDVIVATTKNKLDDKIVEFCKKYNFNFYRGSESDVLDRISSMIQKYNIDIHVELFGDSPFSDPIIIDNFLKIFITKINSVDFLSNSIKTTYPPGMEVIIYKGNLLVEVNKVIEKNNPLREHVSMHLYNNKNLKVLNLEAPKHYLYPEIYLEVDTDVDFELVKIIFEYFINKKKFDFTLSDILNFLNKNKNLIEINKSVNRRWKKYRIN